MTNHERALIEIATLALSAINLEVAPPPATETDPPEPAPKMKGRKRRKHTPKAEPKKAGTGPGKGNYPRKKKYECTACHHRFKSKESLLDVTCPDCNSTNVIKQPQDRMI